MCVVLTSYARDFVHVELKIINFAPIVGSMMTNSQKPLSTIAQSNNKYIFLNPTFIS